MFLHPDIAAVAAAIVAHTLLASTCPIVPRLCLASSCLKSSIININIVIIVRNQKTTQVVTVCSKLAHHPRLHIVR